MNTQTLTAKRGPKPNTHTRDNLLRAGVKMLHESGYSATGIQDIVSAAGVPKGSFYNHFASKEAFGREVVDFYFSSHIPELKAVLTDPDALPLQRLRNFFEQQIKNFNEIGFVRGCLMGNLSLEVADHSEIIRDNIAANFMQWAKLFEDCIKEAQESAAVSRSIPAPNLAQFILNSWEGALLRMRVVKDDRPLRDFCDVVFGSLLI